MDITSINPYPLVFTPINVKRVWGGSRMSGALGKHLPAGQPIGESWDLVDLAEAQSRVALGPATGIGLHELVQQWEQRLMGPAALDGGRFPLLVKYLDAAKTLSVQVHPDAEVAARHGGRPKSEAWYILDREPGGVIYRGLQPGTTREDFHAGIEGGQVEQLLQSVEVQPGDLIPVPPGTVHAIGAGVLLAEVQQPSDTTYRVYDWGRVGLDGSPRALHVSEALESIHFDRQPPPMVRQGTVEMGMFRMRLAEVEPGEGLELEDEGPVVLVGLKGAGVLEARGHAAVACALGTVLLAPHVCRPARFSSAAGARVLQVTFPRSS
jgi:mannose-6-phosphate isomerase